MGFKTTNRFNPCPICGDTSGDCKHGDDNLVLCVKGVDGNISIAGYHYTHNDKGHDRWGVYAPTGNYNEEAEQTYKEKAAAEEKARKEHYLNSLSNSDRDKNYKATYKALGLLSSDKDNLKKRGLTDEQIKEGKFFSINGQSELPTSISLQFAGVNPLSASRNTIGHLKTSGFSCPAFSYQGEIIGFQIRNNAPNDNFNAKYYWAKSKNGNDSKLQNGELPITYLGKGKDKLYLVEGILKPFIAHCLHDIDVVGASGGHWASSPQQLLEITANYDEIYLIPDGGAVSNRNVCKQISSVYELIKREQGKEIKIAWYEQIEKTDGDIDEIESFDYISLAFEEWEEKSEKLIFKKDKKNKLKKATDYTADQSFNVRFIANSLKGKIDGCKVFGVKSPKNSGKTFWLANLIEEIDTRYILIGNRKTLTKELTQKLPHFTYVDMSITADDVEMIWEEEDNWKHRLGVVLDSFLKLKTIDFNGAIILIDEAEQFLDSLLLGKTHVKKFRGQILAVLMEKLKECGAVVLCDADLSDFTVDYFSKASGKPSFKFENTYQENNRNLLVYENIEEIISVIHSSVEKFENIFIVSDSKKQLTALADTYADRGKRVLLLTRENLNDNPDLHRYLSNHGELIKKDRIQIVLGSPVIQSGISIELGDYFHNYVGIFQGVVPPNVASQMLIRDRGNCDRHIWANARGLDYSNDFNVDQLIQSQQFKEYILPEAAQYMQFAESIEWEDSVIKVANLMKQNKACKDLNTVTVAQLMVKKNLQASDFKENLLDKLKAENYTVTESDFLINSGINGLVSDRKILNDEKEALGICRAEDIDENQAKILSNKDGLKKPDREKLNKHFFQKKLPNVPLDPDLILQYVVKDSYRQVNAIENYVLARNPEVSKNLDIQNLNYLLHQSEKGGIFWVNDSRTRSTMVKLFEALPIQKWIDEDLVIINDDLFRTMSQHRKSLKMFGIKWCDKSYRLPVVKKLLKLFGFTTYNKSNSNSKKEITYGVKPIIDKDYFNLFVNSLTTKHSVEIDIKYTTTQHENLKTAFNTYTEGDTGRGENGSGVISDLGFPPTSITYTQSSPAVSSIFSDFEGENTIYEEINPENTPDLKAEKTTVEKNTKNKDLISKKCNYFDNNDNWVTGFIVDVLDFGIQLSDSNNNISYCDLSQIEFIEDTRNSNSFDTVPF
jgi:hypothetical protein